jgi:hypothetical protein
MTEDLDDPGTVLREWHGVHGSVDIRVSVDIEITEQGSFYVTYVVNRQAFPDLYWAMQDAEAVVAVTRMAGIPMHEHEL